LWPVAVAMSLPPTTIDHQSLFFLSRPVCIGLWWDIYPHCLLSLSNSWYVAIHACICWHAVALHVPVCAAVHACLHLFKRCFVNMKLPVDALCSQLSNATNGTRFRCLYRSKSSLSESVSKFRVEQTNCFFSIPSTKYFQMFATCKNCRKFILTPFWVIQIAKFVILKDLHRGVSFAAWACLYKPEKSLSLKR
jgi:hypothetical protein